MRYRKLKIAIVVLLVVPFISTIAFGFTGGGQWGAVKSFLKRCSVSIIPSKDDSVDLGSSAKQWKDGYFDGTLYADAILSGGNITMDDDTWIGLGAAKGRLVFDDDGDNVYAQDLVKFIMGGTASGFNSGFITVSNSNANSSLESYSATDSVNGKICFLKSNSVTIGTLEATDDGDYLGLIEFNGVDSGNIADAGATIQAIQVGAAGTKIAAKVVLTTYNSTGANGSVIFNELGGVDIQDADGLTLGEDTGTNVAGKMKLISAGANGYSTTFTAGTQSQDAGYTLPTALPTANNQRLVATTGGVMSWDTNVKVLSIPVTNPAGTEDFLVWRAPANLTISVVNGCSMDGTSLTCQINEADANGDNPVQICDDTAVTVSNTALSITNASVDAGDWISFTSSAESGDVTKMCLVVEYTFD